MAAALTCLAVFKARRDESLHGNLASGAKTRPPRGDRRRRRRKKKKQRPSGHLVALSAKIPFERKRRES